MLTCSEINEVKLAKMKMIWDNIMNKLELIKLDVGEKIMTQLLGTDHKSNL